MTRKVNVDLSNSIEAWRQKTNLLSDYIGDLDNMSIAAPHDSSVVSAINRLDALSLTTTQVKSLFAATNSGPTDVAGISYNSSTGTITLTTPNVLPVARIPELPYSKMSGTIPNSQIPSTLDAGKLSTGTVNVARLPSIPFSKITGNVDSSQISSLSATKIDGTLTSNQVPLVSTNSIFVESDGSGNIGFAPALYGTRADRAMLLTSIDSAVSGQKTFTGGINLNSTLHFGASATVQGTSFDLGADSNKFANVYATTFQGVATSAKYADLAEKYTTDEEYPTGTCVEVSDSPTSECTVSQSDCIGVISAQPAFLMNSDADGQAIALKGRVPVRAMGPIQKGSKVYLAGDGIVSSKWKHATDVLVGIALETNLEESEKLVECVLKI